MRVFNYTLHQYLESLDMAGIALVFCDKDIEANKIYNKDCLFEWDHKYMALNKDIAK